MSETRPISHPVAEHGGVRVDAFAEGEVNREVVTFALRIAGRHRIGTVSITPIPIAEINQHAHPESQFACRP